LAVLYLHNKSGLEDDKYFRDGVTEDIIIELSRLTDLSVVPIASVREYRDRPMPATAVGRQLDASHVLDGSLRRVGQRLRLSLHLLETSTGGMLWEEKYHREVDDVFAIQQEIAHNIAEKLRVVLTEAEKASMARVPTTKVAAYDLYLRGRQHFRQFRRKSIEFAHEMFERAINVDPEYAGAHAGLADCYSYLYMFWESDPEYLEKADQASRKAVELNGELPEARVARGVAISIGEDYEKADEEFRIAIRMDPNFFEAYYFCARGHYARGRLDRAVYWFRKAMEVRPEDYQAPTLLGSALRGLGLRTESDDAYRQAVALAQKHLEIHPGDVRALYFSAIALAQLRERKQQALEWAERALAMDPEEPQVLYNVGCFYALQGMPDKSIDCLEKTVAHGDWWRGWMKNDPDLEVLHDHPGFKTLVGVS
jgi:TolB-like protein/Tfp pilus assembly protein PilF